MPRSGDDGFGAGDGRPGTASSSRADVTIGRVVCGLRFNAKAVHTDVYSDFLVTDSQGRGAEGSGRQVTNMQGRNGLGCAKGGARKMWGGMELAAWVISVCIALSLAS